jgi:hypothetical protein
MVPPARVAAAWPWLLFLALFSSAAADGCALGVTSYGAPFWDGGPSGSDDGPPFPTGDSSGACRPGDVETYHPAAYTPAAGAWQGVCSPGDIGRLGPQRTTAACDAFTSDKMTGPCAACILTPPNATHDGPLLNHGTFITANVAGCIELTDRGSLMCARVVQALGGCELAACQANCPVHDSTSLMAYNACAVQADQAGCQTYARQAACIDAAADAGQVATCLISTFPDFYNAVVPLFCGAPTGLDGGTLPQFDASADAPSAAPDASTDGQSDAPAIDGATDGSADAPTDVRADVSGDAAKD